MEQGDKTLVFSPPILVLAVLSLFQRGNVKDQTRVRSKWTCIKQRDEKPRSRSNKSDGGQRYSINQDQIASRSKVVEYLYRSESIKKLTRYISPVIY